MIFLQCENIISPKIKCPGQLNMVNSYRYVYKQACKENTNEYMASTVTGASPVGKWNA